MHLGHLYLIIVIQRSSVTSVPDHHAGRYKRLGSVKLSCFKQEAVIHLRNAFSEKRLHASGILANRKHLRPCQSSQLNKQVPIDGTDLAGDHVSISQCFFFFSVSSAPLFEWEFGAGGDLQFWPGNSRSLGFWTPQPITLLGGFWLQKDWGMCLPCCLWLSRQGGAGLGARFDTGGSQRVQLLWRFPENCRERWSHVQTGCLPLSNRDFIKVLEHLYWG